jgi:putative toxin-antitoxin system antitoxin component (TIGR02293 family)
MAANLVLDWLGGMNALGKKAGRELDFDEEIKRGFRSEVFLSFKTKTGLPNSVLSRILGVSDRSINRYHQSQRLKPLASDRLYRMAKVLALAESVLEDREQALSWMSSNQKGLGNRKPFDLVETDAGAREVEEELLRIEHGFVA